MLSAPITWQGGLHVLSSLRNTQLWRLGSFILNSSGFDRPTYENGDAVDQTSAHMQELRLSKQLQIVNLPSCWPQLCVDILWPRPLLDRNHGPRQPTCMAEWSTIIDYMTRLRAWRDSWACTLADLSTSSQGGDRPFWSQGGSPTKPRWAHLRYHTIKVTLLTQALASSRIIELQLRIRHCSCHISYLTMRSKQTFSIEVRLRHVIGIQ